VILRESDIARDYCAKIINQLNNPFSGHTLWVTYELGIGMSSQWVADGGEPTKNHVGLVRLIRPGDGEQIMHAAHLENQLRRRVPEFNTLIAQWKHSTQETAEVGGVQASHEYWLGVAEAVGKRSTCPDNSTGCVIVAKDSIVVSVGWYGYSNPEHGCQFNRCPPSPSKTHPAGTKRPCAAMHAEARAIWNAQLDLIKGATLYSTAEPCDLCRQFAEAGDIGSIVWPTEQHHYPVAEVTA
jgi:dCMP deaminase